jgi:mono/diheme cytochrome c family protein
MRRPEEAPNNMKTWKKAVLGLVAGLFVLVSVGLPAAVGIRPFIGPHVRPLTNLTYERTPQRLERGRYLVTTAQTPCLVCHSPLDATGGGLKVKEGMELAGRNWEADGAPFVTAPNLTPDPETGIGGWSDDAVARAIREGIGHDGRTLFPIMPYEHYRTMSDEDVASIIVYLRSVQPIRNPLPKSAVPFPLNRLIMGVPQPVEAPVHADLSTPEKRGEYIVNLAVCSECHTPMDGKGNKVAGMDFAGGQTMPFEGVKPAASANLTPSPNGIPYYTEELFIETFRTGKVRSRELSPMMPTRYFGKMTDQDLKDVFAYLKTLKPVDHYVDNSLPPTLCAKCGLTHGGGARNKKGGRT